MATWRHCLRCVLSGLAAAWLLTACRALAIEPAADEPLLPVEGYIHTVDGRLVLERPRPVPRAQGASIATQLPVDGYIRFVNGRLVLQEEAVQPERPSTPQEPAAAAGGDQTTTGQADEIRGGGFEALDILREAQVLPQAAGAPSDAVAPNQQAAPPVDLAGALEQSSNVQSMNVQLRNLGSLDPRVRGYRYGQIYTQGDGAFWIPVRQDLDTPLSMFDPAVVQVIEVVPGPYSLRYGPGLSYLNVLTTPTPRYECFEAHAFAATSYYGNGNLLNASQRIYGGNSDWGFSVLHGTRDGNYYTSGNGTTIPSRYNNEDFFSQFGFDLRDDRHIEFRMLRQDQTDAVYPGQFFKTDIAITEGYTVQWIDDSEGGLADKFLAECWYNIGHLRGGTDPNETIFNVVARVDQALSNAGVPGDPDFGGKTNASTISTGGRLAWVIGEEGENQLTTGLDFRYINQYVNEDFQFMDGSTPVRFSTGLPRSYMTDAGIYAEYKIPLSDNWITTIGGRLDWIHSDLDGPLPDNYPDQLGSELSQNNVLTSLFLTNELQLDEYWTAAVNFAQAQRPPTLTERYADGEFLAMIQSGFSRVVGLPTISPERAWQMDASLTCNTDVFRGRVSAFYSFIVNYSTFIAFPVLDPTGARLLFTTTTPLATLGGFEAYGERDLDDYWTVFGSLLYVGGRDQTLGAPLTQIYPFEARLGVRIHDPDGGNRWGWEWFARMVDDQDRLGTLRSGFSGDNRVVVELPTGGFTTWNMRAYYNASEHFSYVAGINNMFDMNYIEHLSLRFAPNQSFAGIGVLSPGITPYVGINMTY